MEEEQVIQGGVYRHYKNPKHLYRVLGTAFDSETKEEMIIYRQLYDSLEFKKRTQWVRSKKSFLEDVTLGNDAKIPRFEFIGTEMPGRKSRGKKSGKL